MKEIHAIIQWHLLSRVLQPLHELPHFPGVTVIDVHGQGAGGAFLLTEDDIKFHMKSLIHIACADGLADEIAASIVENTRTDSKGDGIITIKDVAQVIRIRTGESAEQAI
jgi:nitrogen regulatory protein P-II 1